VTVAEGVPVTERIRRTLVALRMPRELELLDHASSMKSATYRSCTVLAISSSNSSMPAMRATLADIVGTLAKAEREGQLRERIRWFGRAALLRRRCGWLGWRQSKRCQASTSPSNPPLQCANSNAVRSAPSS